MPKKVDFPTFFSDPPKGCKKMIMETLFWSWRHFFDYGDIMVFPSPWIPVPVQVGFYDPTKGELQQALYDTETEETVEEVARNSSSTQRGQIYSVRIVVD